MAISPDDTCLSRGNHLLGGAHLPLLSVGAGLIVVIGAPAGRFGCGRAIRRVIGVPEVTPDCRGMLPFNGGYGGAFVIFQVSMVGAHHGVATILDEPREVAEMSRCRRRQYVVDQPVQGTLMFRVVGYWLFCLLTVTLLLVCWTVFTDTPRSSNELFHKVWFRYGPALAASLVVLPIVVMDCMRMSNRFVGPMYRFRNSLRQLIDGEFVRPIVLREKDFWVDVAADFNRVIDMVQTPRDEDVPGVVEPDSESSTERDENLEPESVS